MGVHRVLWEPVIFPEHLLLQAVPRLWWSPRELRKGVTSVKLSENSIARLCLMGKEELLSGIRMSVTDPKRGHLEKC